MEGLRAGARVAIVVLAVLSLAACGDPGSSSGSDGSLAPGGDADEVVAAAVGEVLGDGPFRSRTRGATPFLGDMDSVYEQSGGDVVDITVSDGSGSATVISGDTAYEWDATSQGWTETPLESFDPLLGPGFMFGLALVGLFELPDGAEGDVDGSGMEPGMPPVATGWTEVDAASDGTRRFERRLPPTWFSGGVGDADDVPVERREEAAITGEFYRSAETVVVVEVDRDGHLASHTLRVVFDGAADYPDCAPMARYVGTTEMITEFSDVGADVTITVPVPAQLVVDFPVLGQPPEPVDLEDPEFLDLDDAGIDRAFRNDAGERDLSGCPPPEQPSTDAVGPSTTTVESCQVEGLTIRTAVLAFQAETGRLPASLEEVTGFLVDPPSDEWSYRVDGDEFELDGPCELP